MSPLIMIGIKLCLPSISESGLDRGCGNLNGSRVTQPSPASEERGRRGNLLIDNQLGSSHVRVKTNSLMWTPSEILDTLTENNAVRK